MQNNATYKGAECLGEALKQSNCKLNSLVLHFNKLTDGGIKYLAEALKHSNMQTIENETTCTSLVTSISAIMQGKSCMVEVRALSNCNVCLQK